MTDLSSESPQQHPEMANMAGELIQAKMDMARQHTQMTHVLRIGPFHMEVVPSKDIDIEKMFKSVMEDLHKKYGDKILQISLAETQQRHYG